MGDLATARHAWVTARAGGSTDAETDAAGEYIRLLEQHLSGERQQDCSAPRPEPTPSQLMTFRQASDPERATRLAADIADSYGITTRAASVLLAKALMDPIRHGPRLLGEGLMPDTEVAVLDKVAQLFSPPSPAETVTYDGFGAPIVHESQETT